MTFRPGARAAAALAVAVCAAAVVVVFAARAGVAGAYGSGPFAFPHQPHLSAEAVAAGLAASGGAPAKAGADRECRVCHDYEKGDAAHLTGCVRCHVDASHLAVKTSAASPAPASAPFPHREHMKDASISCFTCHLVRKEMGWVEFTIPEGGLGVAGKDGRPGGRNGERNCADCHRDHEPRGGRVTKDEVTGDGRRCAECHAGATSILPLRYRPNAGNDRSFLHADHGGADADCDRCHAPVRTSRTIWDYDPAARTAEACRTCHVDAEGKPLVGFASPGRTTKIPFVLFSRFPHDRHLAAPEGKIETSGKVTDACRTCHYPEKDPAAAKLFPGRVPSAEPVGRVQLVDYDTCTPCHAAWKVEGHGVGAWSCFKCHAGTPDAQGRLAMANAQVTRSSLPGGVQFAEHHHPGVAKDGAPLSDASQPGGKVCADCHVGDVRKLASRLEGRTFQHAPHLPAEPTPRDCLGCHTTSGTASWSADLERFDAHVEAPVTASGVAGGARGCLVCHVGATAAQLGATPQRRVVREFDHRAHVTSAKWNGATGVPCTECHVARGPVGFTTEADVYDCTRCHSHDASKAEKFARTGRSSSSQDDAKDCAHCHEEVREQPPAVVSAPRTHLSLLPGRQHHDRGGDCASCHARDGRPYVYAERIASAKVTLSIHEDRALCDEWFNDPKIAQAGADPQGRTCRTCHVSEPRGYLRALTRR